MAASARVLSVGVAVQLRRSGQRDRVGRRCIGIEGKKPAAVDRQRGEAHKTVNAIET